MKTRHILLLHLLRKVDQVMADLSTLTAAVDQLAATDASVVAELQRLSGIIAAGGTVSQADIDALTARVQGVSTDISDAIAADPQ